MCDNTNTALTSSEANSSQREGLKSSFTASYTDKKGKISSVTITIDDLLQNPPCPLVFHLKSKLNKKESSGDIGQEFITLNKTVTFDVVEETLRLKINESNFIPLDLNAHNTFISSNNKEEIKEIEDKKDKEDAEEMIREIYSDGMAIFNYLSGTAPVNPRTDFGPAVGPITPDLDIARVAAALMFAII